jgi:hypothetical protein
MGSCELVIVYLTRVFFFSDEKEDLPGRRHLDVVYPSQAFRQGCLQSIKPGHLWMNFADG